jgi:hypothetical protein
MQKKKKKMCPILDRIKYADNQSLTVDTVENAPCLHIKSVHIFGSYCNKIVGIRTKNKY